MLADLGIGLLAKIAIPLLDWGWRGATRQAPRWLESLKQFVRRETLERTVSDDERFVAGLFNGRQWDYASLLKMSDGRFDTDSLLPVMTSLQAKGLVNKPRLAEPPNPRAMFTGTADVGLLQNRPRAKNRLPRARKRDVEEAVLRRRQLATALERQAEHEVRCRRGGFIPEQATVEADARLAQIEEHRKWLAERGF